MFTGEILNVYFIIFIINLRSWVCFLSSTGEKEFAAAFFQFIGRGLAQGWFSSHPYEVRKGELGGIEGVLKDLEADKAWMTTYQAS